MFGSSKKRSAITITLASFIVVLFVAAGTYALDIWPFSQEKSLAEAGEVEPATVPVCDGFSVKLADHARGSLDANGIQGTEVEEIRKEYLDFNGHEPHGLFMFYQASPLEKSSPLHSVAELVEGDIKDGACYSQRGIEAYQAWAGLFKYADIKIVDQVSYTAINSGVAAPGVITYSHGVKGADQRGIDITYFDKQGNVAAAHSALKRCKQVTTGKPVKGMVPGKTDNDEVSKPPVGPPSPCTGESCKPPTPPEECKKENCDTPPPCKTNNCKPEEECKPENPACKPPTDCKTTPNKPECNPTPPVCKDTPEKPCNPKPPTCADTPQKPECQPKPPCEANPTAPECQPKPPCKDNCQPTPPKCENGKAICGTPDTGAEQQPVQDNDPKQVAPTPGYKPGAAEQNDQQQGNPCSGASCSLEPTPAGTEVKDSIEGGKAPGGAVTTPGEPAKDTAATKPQPKPNPDYDSQKPTENPDKGTGEPANTSVGQNASSDPFQDLSLPNP